MYINYIDFLESFQWILIHQDWWWWWWCADFHFNFITMYLVYY